MRLGQTICPQRWHLRMAEEIDKTRRADLPSEADEIADNMAVKLRRRDLPETMDQARAIVRAQMPDEGPQLIDNIAESLLARGKYK